MTQLSCKQITARDLAARYLAGTLTASEAAEFEDHYVACSRCQDELHFAIGGRVALAGRPPATVRRLRLLGAAATLAAAAVLVLMTRGRNSSADPRFAALGAVPQPPIYLGVQVRALAGTPDLLFEQAMDAYAANRYDVASSGLARARAGGADPAVTGFFLASSLLMQGRVDDAAAIYREVIALGDTPYRAEAHFYLAKALLRLGKGREALEHLRTVTSGDGPLPAQAKSLADSVEDVLRR